jgi:hypothetical protein
MKQGELDQLLAALEAVAAGYNAFRDILFGLPIDDEPEPEPIPEPIPEPEPEPIPEPPSDVLTFADGWEGLRGRGPSGEPSPGRASDTTIERTTFDGLPCVALTVPQNSDHENAFQMHHQWTPADVVRYGFDLHMSAIPAGNVKLARFQPEQDANLGGWFFNGGSLNIGMDGGNVRVPSGVPVDDLLAGFHRLEVEFSPRNRRAALWFDNIPWWDGCPNDPNPMPWTGHGAEWVLEGNHWVVRFPNAVNAPVGGIDYLYTVNMPNQHAFTAYITNITRMV